MGLVFSTVNLVTAADAGVAITAASSKSLSFMSSPLLFWRDHSSAPLTVQRRELRVAQGKGCGRHILLEMRDFGSPRNGEHCRAAFQQPGQGHLSLGGAPGLGDLVQHAARPG